jgi:hypothetical protein
MIHRGHETVLRGATQGQVQVKGPPVSGRMTTVITQSRLMIWFIAHKNQREVGVGELLINKQNVIIVIVLIDMNFLRSFMKADLVV